MANKKSNRKAPSTMNTADWDGNEREATDSSARTQAKDEGAVTPSSAAGTMHQVLHRERDTMHLYDGRGSVTICKFWTCGTPDAPTEHADFASAKSGHKCRACHSRGKHGPL